MISDPCGYCVPNEPILEPEEKPGPPLPRHSTPIQKLHSRFYNLEQKNDQDFDGFYLRRNDENRGAGGILLAGSSARLCP